MLTATPVATKWSGLMTLRLNRDRLKRMLIASSFESDAGAVIKLGELFEILRSLECKSEPCTNEARYSSGYCGICDIQFNDGAGKRITHPE